MAENKAYKVIVSGRAAQMMTAHATFLANVSGDAAEKLVQEFEEASASLSQQPFRAPYLTSPMLPQSVYRKLVLAKRYMLLYRVVEQMVLIEYVVDCRQGYGWLLQNR